MPALTYPAARAAATAASPIRARTAGRQRRAGAFLDRLLVPPLNRALTLEQMNDVAVSVGEHLHLDVSRPLDQPLHVERAVAERGLRLAPCALDGVSAPRPSSATVFMPMPPPPADGLIERRQADARRPRRRAPHRSDRFGVSPGTTGTPASCIRRRAPIFDPMRSSAPAGGRRRSSPASLHARAKRARSERKP